MKSLEARCSDFVVKLASAEAQVAASVHWEALTSELNATAAELSESLAISESRHDDLQLEFETYRVRVESNERVSRAEIASLRDSVRILSAQLKSRETELLAHAKSVESEFRNSMCSLSDKLNVSESERVLLHLELQRLKDLLEVKEAMAADAASRTEATTLMYTLRIEKLQEQIESLEVEKDAVTSENMDLECRISQLEKSLFDSNLEAARSGEAAVEVQDSRRETERLEKEKDRYKSLSNKLMEGYISRVS